MCPQPNGRAGAGTTGGVARRHRCRTILKMFAAGVAVCLLALPVPAAAAPGGGGPAQRIAAGLPQELAAYGPQRLADLATGAGVRVAVLDSGVDGAHPQLRGRVVAGRDV